VKYLQLSRAAAAALICLLTGCKPAPKLDAQGAADAFFAKVEKGDMRGAYDAAAFAFQAGQSFEGFETNAHDLGFIGAQPPAWTHEEVQDTTARLDGKLVTQNGSPLNVSLSMATENGEWKLLSLRTSDPQHYWEPEDHFSSLGKGVGFNDVYHQPMPGPRELAALVHGTLADFNNAVRTADFHSFYRSVSQRWRDKAPEEGGGVTEKMIKDHFQGFIDYKIDLSPVLDMAPIMDDVPMINEQGLLVLNGHFNGPQFRVNFHLEYTYELPRWKLYGIDVTVKK
jgi:hypothetical protein